MRPMYRCPENFRESLSTPTATFPEIFNGLLSRSILWMCVQNLKFVALPVPEIIGYCQKIGQSLVRPCSLSSKKFNGLLFGWTRPNFNSVALPVPEIIAIEIFGGVANSQSWGRGGHTGSKMVPFERALVSSYRASIVTFSLSLLVLCSSTSLFRTPPLVSPKFLHVPLEVVDDLWATNSEVRGYLSVQLVFKISNLYGPDPPMLQTDRRTDHMQSQYRASH